MPAPANRAAAPTAAVFIGIAAAFDDDEAIVRALMLALEAPAKATDWVEAAGLGAAEVLLGFKTLRLS